MVAGLGMCSQAATCLHILSMSRVEGIGSGVPLSLSGGKTAEPTGCAALGGIKMSSSSSYLEMRNLETTLLFLIYSSSRTLSSMEVTEARSSSKPQPAVADGAVAAVSPHPFSSLMPGVAEGRQGSTPERLVWPASCQWRLFIVKTVHSRHAPFFTA